MKTKPCKHPKGERYVDLVKGLSKIHKFTSRDYDLLTTYCAKCGKKLREVEVHD